MLNKLRFKYLKNVRKIFNNLFYVKITIIFGFRLSKLNAL